MKRFPFFGLFLGLFFVGCEVQLDEPVAEMTLQTRSAVEVLPADAQFVGMVDLQAFRNSETLDPFSEHGLSLEGDDSEMAARLQDFLNATGFDPEEDLREVYVAAPSEDAAPSLVVYANFDRARLLGYVEDNFSGEFEKTSYKSFPAYLAREADEQFAFAIANDNMMVASPEMAEVHAMLDRLAGTGRALDDDAEVMRLVKQVGGGNAWFVARGIDTQFDEARHGHKEHEAMERDMAQIGRALQDMAATLTVEQTGLRGNMWMVTRPGVAASDVADLMKGVVAAMKAGEGANKQMMETLDGVRIRPADDRVQVSFFVENEMLASMR